MSERFDSAIKNISVSLRDALCKIPKENKSEIFEIRLRVGAPVMLISSVGTQFLRGNGRTSFLYSDEMLTASKSDIDETFLRLCEYSVHSFENEIREGFLTTRDGHRAGICGKVSCNEDGTVRGFSEITSVNLRIARDFKGVSGDLCRKIFGKGLCSAIIAGPPVSGKTTMLRDMGRFLSEGLLGEYYKVSVIDSRREISADNLFLKFCDVFSGCEKSYGIISAIRSMSPQMVICDELSTVEEVKAVSKGFSSGTEFLLSVHANGIEELQKRPVFSKLLKTGQFRYTVMLKGDVPCVVENIYETEDLL